jgi:hypothetical protein
MNNGERRNHNDQHNLIRPSFLMEVSIGLYSRLFIKPDLYCFILIYKNRIERFSIIAIKR